jgi:hypothetical protein
MIGTCSYLDSKSDNIEKLSNSNWPTWSTRVTDQLVTKYLDTALDPTVPTESSTPAETALAIRPTRRRLLFFGLMYNPSIGGPVTESLVGFRLFYLPE